MLPQIFIFEKVSHVCIKQLSALTSALISVILLNFLRSLLVTVCVLSFRGDRPSKHEGGWRLHRETSSIPVR